MSVTTNVSLEEMKYLKRTQKLKNKRKAIYRKARKWINSYGYSKAKYKKEIYNMGN